MADDKKIIISVELKDDGTVQIKQLKDSLDQATQSQKKLTQAKVGTEKAILDEIKALKAERAATATTAKAYQDYSIKITQAEAQLRELTSARKADVQVNADFISNQGLASNTITEFGRLISDLPFGIIAVTNNISQLGSNFGNLSRKTGDVSTSFKILLRQLKKGGALILAFQVLIALVTAYGDKILDFIRGNDEASRSAKELAKSLKETTAELRGEEIRLLSLVNVLEDVTSSREAQKNAIDELAKVLPGLNKEEISSKNNIDATRQAIEKYIQQQLIRAELDALIAQNSEKFRLRSLIEQVNEDDPEAVDKFLKENVSFFKRFGAGAALGFGQALRTQRDELFQQVKQETFDLTETAINDIVELQKKITGEEDEENARERVSVLFFGKDFKKNIGKTTKEISDEINKSFDKIRDIFGLKSFSDQLKEIKSNSKGVINILADQEEKRKENHKKELDRIQEEFDKRNQLANNISSAVKKLSQIQDQAYQSQIQRLDTERDIILNNDNLTAEEKDRLLKKNDVESRKVKTKQIKFERDMHMIEMSMELAKIGLQLQNAMTQVISAGGTEVGKATMSLGSFVQQLGPAGIAAYAVSIGGIIATIVSARKKAEQQIQALSNQSLAVSGGGGASSPQIQAPAFNVVGATQTSQLAQTISQAEQQPIKAYVVASDVTTAQELERSTIEGASIG